MATDTVLADAVCSTDPCSDTDCCEPGEHVVAADVGQACAVLLVDALLSEMCVACLCTFVGIAKQRVFRETRSVRVDM